MNHGKQSRIVFVVLLLGAMAALARAQWSGIYTFNRNVEGCCANQPSLLAQGTDGSLYGTLPSGARTSFGGWFRYGMSGAPSVTSFRGYQTSTGVVGDTNMGGSNSGYTLGIDGNLYGSVDFAVGTTSVGAIIESTGGTPSVVYTFKGTTIDAVRAKAPPVQGLDMNLYAVTNDGGNTGIVIQIFPATSSHGWMTKLPGSSNAPLILGSDGNFYGTYGGGNFSTVNGVAVANSGGGGGIFQITPAGVIGWYHNFATGSADGSNPIGGLIQGADGYLYGTTAGGGYCFGCGVVFKIAASSASLNNTAYTVLHPFQYADGEAPHCGVVQGSDGYLYGLTSTGGTLSAQGQSAGYLASGTLYKVSSTGTNFTSLYTFFRLSGSDGRGPGSDPESSLTLHTNGLLYGWTHAGGFSLIGSGPGANDDGGEFFNYNAGLSPFISVVGRRSAHAGDRVGIIGQGFLNATGVTFGGASVSWTKFNVTIWNDNYMTVVVPPGAQTGTVAVQETTGPLYSLYRFTITCSGPLCITHL